MLEELSQWGTPEDSFEVVSVSDNGPAGWLATVRSRDEDPSIMNLQHRPTEVRLWITHRVDCPGELSDRKQREDLHQLVVNVELARAGTLRCVLNHAGAESFVEIHCAIYDDSFTRQELNRATTEVVKARGTLLGGFETMVAARQVGEKIQKDLDSLDDDIARLREESRAGRSTETEPPSDGHTQEGFCRSCGAALVKSNSFCTSCGGRQ